MQTLIARKHLGTADASNFVSVASHSRKGGLLDALGFAAVVLVSVTAADAALVNPSGLPNGTKFRYIYETTGTTAATSTTNAFYDAFATADATALGYTTYNATPITWTALVGVNSAPKGLVSSEDPFFVPGGNQISASSTKLFDGTALLSAISSSSATVWTGAGFAGFLSPGNQMGAANVSTGQGNLTTSGWLNNGSTDVSSNLRPIYAFSNELTAVPEPTSLAVVGTSVALGLLRRRRHASANFSM